MWSWDIRLKLTRLLWLCIVLAQLWNKVWKVKRINVTISWSILNTCTKAVSTRSKKSVHYTTCILPYKNDTALRPGFLQNDALPLFLGLNLAENQSYQWLPGGAMKQLPLAPWKVTPVQKIDRTHKHKQTNNWYTKCQCRLTSVPDLGLDSFSINLYTSGSKFYTNCGLGLQIKFVSREPRQQIWFSNTRVAYENNC